MEFFFHFGTGNWEEQLKNTLYVCIDVDDDDDDDEDEDDDDDDEDEVEDDDEDEDFVAGTEATSAGRHNDGAPSRRSRALELVNYSHQMTLYYLY